MKSFKSLFVCLFATMPLHASTVRSESNPSDKCEMSFIEKAFDAMVVRPTANGLAQGFYEPKIFPSSMQVVRPEKDSLKALRDSKQIIRYDVPIVVRNGRPLTLSGRIYRSNINRKNRAIVISHPVWWHMGWMESTVESLVRMGYDVAIYDKSSHGLSPRHWEKVDIKKRLVVDQVTAFDVLSNHPSISDDQFVHLAFSLSTFAGVGALAFIHKDIVAVIYDSGPSLRIDETFAKFYMGYLRPIFEDKLKYVGLKNTFNHQAMAAAFSQSAQVKLGIMAKDWPLHNPREIVDFVVTQRLADLGEGIILSPNRTLLQPSNKEEITVPIYLMGSRDDSIIPTKEMEDFFQKQGLPGKIQTYFERDGDHLDGVRNSHRDPVFLDTLQFILDNEVPWTN